jgi:DNA adenine methylase
MASKNPILFRYPGGKFYAINILRPYWNAIDHDEYREPFVGGGSVYFNKTKAKFNWINDKDEELIKTYEVISDPYLREQLISLIDLEEEEATKARWREVLEFEPSNKLETAFRYYYLNRTSFSGKLISPAWGYRPKRSLPPYRWKERIIPCGEKLENIKISNTDFEKVINAPKQGRHTLIFVDPPYYKPSKTKHYRHGFTLEDHTRLAETLCKTEHSFFLTYDDIPEVRDLYKWANIYEASFFYRVENSVTQAGTRKLGFEIVITNYNMNLQTDLFKEG